MAAAATHFRCLVMPDKRTRRGREDLQSVCAEYAMREPDLRLVGPSSIACLAEFRKNFQEEMLKKNAPSRYALFELARARRRSFSYRRFRGITTSQRRLGLRFLEVPVLSGRGSLALFGVI